MTRRYSFSPRQSVLLIVLVAFLAGGCAVSRDPISGKKRAFGYSWAQERQIGQEADAQIVQQYGVYEDAQLQAYVTRIGEEVLAKSHMRRPDAAPEFKETPFTFRVLDSPVINAFALPGGFVYVTRGLLAHLDNEAQLAVVLGHEIGHVAARHASERALKTQLAQVGLIGGAIIGQEALGLPAGNVLDLGGTALSLLLLKYSRDDETQSDKLGVEYSALAHYDAAEGAAFFRSLDRIGQQQEGGGLPTFLSTHPDPGNREKNIVEYAAGWRPQVQMNIVDQEEFLGAIDNIVVGEDPRQGYTENNVFYHPVLRFQFPVPRNFLVINQPTQVVMVPQDQKAILGFKLVEASSAQAAAAEFSKQQGVRVAESSATRVNGFPAYYVLAEATTQDGQNLAILTYYIEYDNRVYLFQGLTLASSFSQYQDEFLRSMKGFNRVTDASVLNAQPTRLRVTKAPRTAPFRSFLPNQLPRDMKAEDLAILNQVELDEQISAGTALKLPR